MPAIQAADAGALVRVTKLYRQLRPPAALHTARGCHVVGYRLELEQRADELQQQIAEISVNNPRVVEEYTRREGEIAVTAAKLTDLTAEVQAAETELEEVKVGVAAAVLVGGVLRGCWSWGRKVKNECSGGWCVLYCIHVCVCVCAYKSVYVCPRHHILQAKWMHVPGESLPSINIPVRATDTRLLSDCQPLLLLLLLPPLLLLLLLCSRVGCRSCSVW
jgi:hypothetical protein